MSAATTAFVLVAAVSHAVWNIASKAKQGDTYLFVWAYTLLSALLLLLVGVVAGTAHAAAWSSGLLIASSVSALLHVVYSLVLQTGYERTDFGVVYPVARGTGPLVTMLVAILVLGERPGWVAVVGAVAVIAGVLVVARVPTRHPRRAGPSPYVWGVATGVAIAAYTLCDSIAIADLHLTPITYYTTTLAIQAVVLTPGALRRAHDVPSSIRSDWSLVGVVAVLSPLSYVFVLIAMQTVSVAIVAPLRESSIVIGALLAWWLFGEQHLTRRLTGAAVVLAGIVTIGLS